MVGGQAAVGQARPAHQDLAQPADLGVDAQGGPGLGVIAGHVGLRGSYGREAGTGARAAVTG
ncbi:hypothetical protein GCM10020256_05300 [Streptomyces thermocoprophilus]